jgi:hypothetical protein
MTTEIDTIDTTVMMITAPIKGLLVIKELVSNLCEEIITFSIEWWINEGWCRGNDWSDRRWRRQGLDGLF